MKTISVTICKTKRPLKLLPLPRTKTNGHPLKGRKLIKWLKEQGAEPIPPKERIRLRKAGFLGMPDE